MSVPTQEALWTCVGCETENPFFRDFCQFCTLGKNGSWKCRIESCSFAKNDRRTNICGGCGAINKSLSGTGRPPIPECIKTTVSNDNNSCDEPRAVGANLPKLTNQQSHSTSSRFFSPPPNHRIHEGCPRPSSYHPNYSYPYVPPPRYAYPPRQFHQPAYQARHWNPGPYGQVMIPYQSHALTQTPHGMPTAMPRTFLPTSASDRLRYAVPVDLFPTLETTRDKKEFLRKLPSLTDLRSRYKFSENWVWKMIRSFSTVDEIQELAIALKLKRPKSCICQKPQCFQVALLADITEDQVFSAAEEKEESGFHKILIVRQREKEDNGDIRTTRNAVFRRVLNIGLGTEIESTACRARVNTSHWHPLVERKLQRNPFKISFPRTVSQYKNLEPKLELEVCNDANDEKDNLQQRYFLIPGSQSALVSYLDQGNLLATWQGIGVKQLLEPEKSRQFDGRPERCLISTPLPTQQPSGSELETMPAEVPFMEGVKELSNTMEVVPPTTAWIADSEQEPELESLTAREPKVSDDVTTGCIDESEQEPELETLTATETELSNILEATTARIDESGQELDVEWWCQLHREIPELGKTNHLEKDKNISKEEKASAIAKAMDLLSKNEDEEDYDVKDKELLKRLAPFLSDHVWKPKPPVKIKMHLTDAGILKILENSSRVQLSSIGNDTSARHEILTNHAEHIREGESNRGDFRFLFLCLGIDVSFFFSPATKRVTCGEKMADEITTYNANLGRINQSMYVQLMRANIKRLDGMKGTNLQHYLNKIPFQASAWMTPCQFKQTLEFLYQRDHSTAQIQTNRQQQQLQQQAHQSLKRQQQEQQKQPLLQSMATDKGKTGPQSGCNQKRAAMPHNKARTTQNIQQQSTPRSCQASANDKKSPGSSSSSSSSSRTTKGQKQFVWITYKSNAFNRVEHPAWLWQQTKDQVKIQWTNSTDKIWLERKDIDIVHENQLGKRHRRETSERIQHHASGKTKTNASNVGSNGAQSLTMNESTEETTDDVGWGRGPKRRPRQQSAPVENSDHSKPVERQPPATKTPQRCQQPTRTEPRPKSAIIHHEYPAAKVSDKEEEDSNRKAPIASASNSGSQRRSGRKRKREILDSVKVESILNRGGKTQPLPTIAAEEQSSTRTGASNYDETFPRGLKEPEHAERNITMEETMPQNNSIHHEREGTMYDLEEFEEWVDGLNLEVIENATSIEGASTSVSKEDSAQTDQKKAVYGRVFPGPTDLIFQAMNLSAKDTFLDIGHGVGITPFQASLTVGCESRGIELISELFKLSQDYANRMKIKIRKERREKVTGDVLLLHGDLADGRNNAWLRVPNKAFFNNYGGVFGPRAGSTGYHLDDYVAGLFASMAEGSILITLYELAMGPTQSEANKWRKRNGHPQTSRASFYEVVKVKVDLDEPPYSWASATQKKMILYVYRRVKQDDDYSRFPSTTCCNRECCCSGELFPAWVLNNKARVVLGSCHKCKCTLKPTRTIRTVSLQEFLNPEGDFTKWRV